MEKNIYFVIKIKTLSYKSLYQGKLPIRYSPYELRFPKIHDSSAIAERKA
ncbi:hypothetical protein [Arsenophonus endosymbiont of Bemisia tabaci]|nr:hypothetical protein [Arsenophonus endosymbiont of Bemisia tabaci]